jgi:hypothetical protein
VFHRRLGGKVHEIRTHVAGLEIPYQRCLGSATSTVMCLGEITSVGRSARAGLRNRYIYGTNWHTNGTIPPHPPDICDAGHSLLSPAGVVVSIPVLAVIASHAPTRASIKSSHLAGRDERHAERDGYDEHGACSFQRKGFPECKLAWRC